MITGKLSSVVADQEFTIFRVPTYIRQKNKELCEPRMVSIGPYYHGENSLQATEKLKLRYLQDLLSNNSTYNIVFGEIYIGQCIDALMPLESQARKCYFEEVKHAPNEFLTMLLLDGCFVIELLIKWFNRKKDTLSDIAWADPIIRSDLVLLDNQIPFFIIQTLFDLLYQIGVIPPDAGNGQKTDLRTMLVKYLLEWKKGAHIPPENMEEIQHILHLYHLCYVPSIGRNRISNPSLFTRIHTMLNLINAICIILIFVKSMLNPFKAIYTFCIFVLRKCKPHSSQGRVPQTIPSATMLHEAGITFQCKKNAKFLDVIFANGTLKIPLIKIQDSSRSRLLNLVSFEQSSGKADKDLTSYSNFMGGLIRTTRDVELLRRKGIVDNLLANDEELVLFFNWLTECSVLNYGNHYLKEVFIELNKYCESNVHKWRGDLKRNYFSNPWSIISVAVAVVLLVLTGLQTFFTVFPYYHPRN
jgi:Plant protein of unknown function